MMVSPVARPLRPTDGSLGDPKYPNMGVWGDDDSTLAIILPGEDAVGRLDDRR
jgi:hypothetical protein